MKFYYCVHVLIYQSLTSCILTLQKTKSTQLVFHPKTVDPGRRIIITISQRQKKGGMGVKRTLDLECRPALLSHRLVQASSGQTAHRDHLLTSGHLLHQLRYHGAVTCPGHHHSPAPHSCCLRQCHQFAGWGRGGHRHRCGGGGPRASLLCQNDG